VHSAVEQVKVATILSQKKCHVLYVQVDAGGSVDLGEIAAQYLGLEISPYPTGPGVKLDLPSSDSDGEIDGGQELKLP
jgi:hypothetical protein